MSRIPFTVTTRQVRKKVRQKADLIQEEIKHEREEKK